MLFTRFEKPQYEKFIILFEIVHIVRATFLSAKLKSLKSEIVSKIKKKH